MSAGFTKGPWRVVGTSQRGSIDIDDMKGRAVAQAQGPDMQANARLIAAAPDMYEALEAVIRFINTEYEDAEASALEGDPLAKDARAVRDKICAALSKATKGD